MTTLSVFLLPLLFMVTGIIVSYLLVTQLFLPYRRGHGIFPMMDQEMKKNDVEQQYIADVIDYSNDVQPVLSVAAVEEISKPKKRSYKKAEVKNKADIKQSSTKKTPVKKTAKAVVSSSKSNATVKTKTVKAKVAKVTGSKKTKTQNLKV